MPCLLEKYGGLHGLSRLRTGAPAQEYGIGPVKSIRLPASFELRRRVKNSISGGKRPFLKIAVKSIRG
ncbi:hypothetical protein [Pajaroellobacter abortibovis]|uniref:hypothetical protein n=1 Tax=Pajaroellobacter abortibovis TaxID=1882918 RepID=UPI0012EBC337|nr:hypothetical protein [Pajaroellobacter abortibovis]